jgi:hypothetical protein
MSSLAQLPLSWLWNRVVAFRPRVSKEGNVLIARSGWRSQLFCLGFAGRKVTVDPQQKIVRIHYRRFWFASTSRRIQFDWVSEVLYGYNEVAPEWGAYTESDLFTVGLKLKTGEGVTLFRFYGAGDFVNNTIWPDWMYWDDFLTSPYLKGDQESESLLYADLLSRMIGVELTNPTP